MTGHEFPNAISCHFNDEDMTAACKRLLQKQSFSTQDDIRHSLVELGFEDISQSTVSRLLAKLKIIKVPNAYGKRVYCLTESTEPAHLHAAISSQIESVTHNQLLVVVKTRPGCAQLVARIIDLHPHTTVLGTIAGNDTIMVAPHDIKQIRECEAAVCQCLGLR